MSSYNEEILEFIPFSGFKACEQSFVRQESQEFHTLPGIFLDAVSRCDLESEKCKASSDVHSYGMSCYNRENTEFQPFQNILDCELS